MLFCSICTNIFNKRDNICATPCGHVFHLDCLMRWIRESETCPECRQSVSSSCLVKLHLHEMSCKEKPNNENDFDFKAELSEEIRRLESQCRKAESQANAYFQGKCKLELQLEKADYNKDTADYNTTLSKIALLEELVSEVKNRSYFQYKKHDLKKNMFIESLKSKIANLEEINRQLNFGNGHLKGVKTIVNDTQLEAEKVLSSYSSNAGEENAAKKLASYCTIVKCHLDGIKCLVGEGKDSFAYYNLEDTPSEMMNEQFQ